MRRLLFLIFLSSIAGIGFANNAVWNCRQDKNSKQWVCVGEKQPPGAAIAPTQPESTGVFGADDTAKQETETPGAVVETPASAPPQEAPAPVVVERPAVIRPETGTKPAISASSRPRPEAATSYQPASRPTGWTCNAGEQGNDWNCNLVGSDPKGEAHIMASEEAVFSLLDPAFDAKQEQVFNNLKSQLKYDPWASCSIEMKGRPDFVPGKDLRDYSPLDVKSDYSEVFDNEISSYSGNVEITRSDQHSLSHAAHYNTISQTLDLHGDVYYSEDELAIYSNSATLKLASDEARIRDVMFISPSTPLRGRASTVYRDSKYLSRYKDVAYTSCPPSNTDWVLHASDLKLNDESGKGAAKNAWLEFKGLPVFYSPYLSFPMDNRRLSGFLAPSFGNTQQSGFDFAVPYYWNIAPNYDLIFKPRYLTERGLLLGGKFRLLTPYSNSIASVEYMPNDSQRDKSRLLASLKNYSRFTSNLTSNLDLNYVSDKEYFSELGNALSFPNFSFVKSSGDISYRDKGISLIGRMVNYQTIDDSISGFRRPYRSLPDIGLKLDHAFDFMPLTTALDGNFVYFQHDSIVNTQRFNIKPSLSFPFKTEAMYSTPKISVQHTTYELNNKNNGVYQQQDDPTVTSAFPDSINRTLPILSLDNGLFLEKDVDLGSSSLKHTVEPRLFYLYIPRKDQSDIPLFDSARYDFWYPSLFRENRFSGSDRVQDANQLSAALTSRLIDPKTGRERLRLDLGQIYYFQDREVTAPLRILYLPGWINLESTNGYLASPPETNSFSPLVAELSSEFTDHWSAETGLQWDPRTNDFVRGKAILHFLNEDEGQIFNVGFLYRKDPYIRDTLIYNLDYLSSPEVNPSGIDPTTLLTNDRIVRGNDIIQSDVSARWPLFDNWFAVGRWQYSWLYNQTQEAFLGFEKENCCWRFRVIGRQWVNNTNQTNINNTINASQIADATSQTGIFFQLELKSLTGIGENLDKFFEQSIYGYRKPRK